MISLSSHHDLLGDHDSINLATIMVFKIVLVGQFNDDDYYDLFCYLSYYSNIWIIPRRWFK